MKTLKVWGICQIEPPRSEVCVDHPCNSVDILLLLERENSWLRVSLPISAFPFRSTLPATGVTVQAFFCKVSMTKRSVHVGCQKRFPMYQASSMCKVAGFGCGSAFHQDLEQLPVDWERGIIFHCRLIRHLEFSRIAHIIHSFLQLLYLWDELVKSSLTFSQFIPGEFVHSHFLSSFSILPLHGYFLNEIKKKTPKTYPHCSRCRARRRQWQWLCSWLVMLVQCFSRCVHFVCRQVRAAWHPVRHFLGGRRSCER